MVWGFADLHAHPGIEQAFKGALVWGSAEDDAPVNAGELPRISACPVETHNLTARGPIDRAVGLNVFPTVAKVASFAHGPVGTGGQRSTSAWPNARDVIHQQMNIGSIRRAYEGGLRLMFASTTDDQVIAALLTGPNFVDGFVPNPAADYESAKAQIELIQRIAHQQSNWMRIARTPAEAREIIEGGRLALVVSLEMNGLRQDELDKLRKNLGARHVFPIHLIDNSVGGTAASSGLFNSASAAVSEIYREDKQPMQYMDVVATEKYSRNQGWPSALVTQPKLPVYVGIQDVPHRAYDALCYEPLAACAGASAATTSFVEFGQQNLKGLCTTLDECISNARPGEQLIRHMMDAGLLIDVSHMSARAVEQTLDIDPRIPLIASHGDIAHLCRGTPTRLPCTDSTGEAPSERALNGDAARELVRRKGVLGLGTGLGVYSSRTVIAARGGPLLWLDPSTGATTGCTALPHPDGGLTAGCEPVAFVERVDPATPIETLKVQTQGGISASVANAQPFVRIELRDPVGPDEFQRRVILTPMGCSTTACSATVPLGKRENPLLPRMAACEARAICAPDAGTCQPDSYTLNDLESVTLQWLYLACDAECQKAAIDPVTDRQCASTWGSERAPTWSMSAIRLSIVGDRQQSTALATLGPRVATPLVVLGKKSGTFTVYARKDRPSIQANLPVTGHLLRVSVTAGTSGQSLPGASGQQVGANACIAVRHRIDGACLPTKPPASEATECPTGDGWVVLNQRGEWQAGVSLYSFVRFPGELTAVCGVDLAILDWGPSNRAFSVDEIRVEAVEDPVGQWVRRYVEIANHVADGQLGTIAFGTDFNGLNGTTDISEFPMPSDAFAASACPATGTSAPAGAPPLPLAPMRFRNPDGTLGEQVLLEERGLATYGLLADFVALVGTYPGCGPDVRDSLMLSAEATLRAWEKAMDPTAPDRPKLPTALFVCDGGFGP
jgi:microsomal dipeptidase-like Zn-dependent dipeptidase